MSDLHFADLLQLLTVGPPSVQLTVRYYFELEAADTFASWRNRFHF